MKADLIFFKIAQNHKRHLVKIFKDIFWLVLLSSISCYKRTKYLHTYFCHFTKYLTTRNMREWFNSYTKFIKKLQKLKQNSLDIYLQKFAVRNAETRKVIRMIAWLGMLEFNETWYFVKCNICSSSPQWAWRREKKWNFEWDVDIYLKPILDF